MYIIPNGQNIQFMHVPSPPPAQDYEPPAKCQPEVRETVLPKNIAPHLNRQQRRAAMVKMRSLATAEGRNLAKKEIAKQKKEKPGE